MKYKYGTHKETIAVQVTASYRAPTILEYFEELGYKHSFAGIAGTGDWYIMGPTGNNDCSTTVPSNAICFDSLDKFKIANEQTELYPIY
jgi:hypothetical protein